MRARTEHHAVLDASAVLAYLQQEPGFERVREALKKGAVISTVNLAEVLTKTTDKGIDVEEVATRLAALGLAAEPFIEDDARTMAQIHSQTRKYGLSLGDRACLALARRLDLPALTADRDWKKLGSAFSVAVIR